MTKINAHDKSDLIPIGDAVYLRVIGLDRKEGMLIIAENGQEIYLSPEAVINFVKFLETGLVNRNDS